MGYARCHLVDPDSPGVYHCVSRCVRRAFLCGVDDETGECWDHRKQWIEDRLHLLAGQFAIVVHAFAVMPNHLHLVVAVDPGFTARWDDAEVVRRWRTVFPVRARPVAVMDDNDKTSGPATQPTVSPAQIALWRQRLGSLSWFMRALVERIARRANLEDHCTGRFWAGSLAPASSHLFDTMAACGRPIRGRFFSQALLDERAILAASVYVDLNPVRAKIAESLQA